MSMGIIAYPSWPMTPQEVKTALRRTRRAKHSDAAAFAEEELRFRGCTDEALAQKALRELERIRQSKPWSGRVYAATMTEAAEGAPNLGNIR